MNSGVYSIRCLLDDRRYVGSSVDIRHRLAQHKYQLGRGTHRNPHLQRAWNKYGAEAFEFRVLEVCAKASIRLREKEIIDRVRPEFNCRGIDPERNLVSHSDETRAKMSAATMGNKKCLGRVMSAETRQKIAKSWERRRLIGFSAETRAKMSVSHTGVPKSAETVAKMRANMLRRYGHET